ncbi:MAG: NADH-quinone oxidoreductase subunit M [Planctomycetota bacterium]|nr:NADH-quinone oxidoreductase subunit M [Planctomycetota bacterium]
MSSLIPIMIFLPAVGAVLLMIFRSSETSVSRWTALWVSLATLGLSLTLAAHDASNMNQQGGVSRASTQQNPVQPRLGFRHTWLDFSESHANKNIPVAERYGRGLKLEFYLGLDGISILMVLLTSLLTVSAILISWESVRERVTEYYVCLLILETGLLGAFCAFDLVLFYIFFEFTLIPLFFLVGIWGGAQRRYAATRFFIYTLSGSLVTLLGLVMLIIQTNQQIPLSNPFSLPELSRALAENPMHVSMQVTLFLALSAGFMIKVPLVPFHTWLPLAHVEAPTAGSVLLAGVLLKLGTVGFLRLALPLLPDACIQVGVPLIATLSTIGIIYGALGALAQNDIKRLVAYSSISHLGFCMLGLFALNAAGISGSILQMLNHGLSTGALFLLVGMIYERYHTRQLTELGGLAQKIPLISVAMIFICFASMGVPGLNGFVGEFLSLLGMFEAHPIYAVIGASGVILGAWYLLTLLQRGFFGPVKIPPHTEHVPDIQLREAIAVLPLAVLCLWIGVYPSPVMKTIEPDVNGLVRQFERDRTTLFENQNREATAQAVSKEIQSQRHQHGASAHAVTQIPVGAARSSDRDIVR